MILILARSTPSYEVKLNWIAETQAAWALSRLWFWKSMEKKLRAEKRAKKRIKRKKMKGDTMIEGQRVIQFHVTPRILSSSDEYDSYFPIIYVLTDAGNMYVKILSTINGEHETWKKII